VRPFLDRLVRLSIPQSSGVIDICRARSLVVILPILYQDPLDLVQVRLEGIQESAGLEVFRRSATAAWMRGSDANIALAVYAEAVVAHTEMPSSLIM
jgi:hypothetical protein